MRHKVYFLPPDYWDEDGNLNTRRKRVRGSMVISIDRKDDINVKATLRVTQEHVHIVNERGIIISEISTEELNQ